MIDLDSPTSYRTAILRCAACPTEQHVEQSAPTVMLTTGALWSPALDDVRRPDGTRWQHVDGRHYCSAECSPGAAAPPSAKPSKGVRS